VQALEAHSLKRACKNFHTTHWCRKSRFAPNTPDPLCAKDTRHLTRFVRNGSIQRSPHPWHRLSLKFGIFIWGRNSNTCQKNRAITDLLNKTKIRQVYYCSGPYICSAGQQFIFWNNNEPEHNLLSVVRLLGQYSKCRNRLIALRCYTHFIWALSVMLQPSFTCNSYYCTKAKPAENLPSSNPVKQIQKNHIQSKPIIQSADSEIMSRKTWPGAVWC